MREYPPIDERLAAKLVPEGDCLVFTGSRLPAGYGQISWDGRLHLAHRVAYILDNGPIPADLEVMHRCNNRACCNPDHLILGTHAQNMAMSVRTHCTQGHEMTWDNTYVTKNGVRQCRACNRRRVRQSQLRKQQGT